VLVKQHHQAAQQLVASMLGLANLNDLFKPYWISIGAKSHSKLAPNFGSVGAIVTWTAFLGREATESIRPVQSDKRGKREREREKVSYTGKKRATPVEPILPFTHTYQSMPLAKSRQTAFGWPWDDSHTTPW
jgi:hypothetical protein